MRLGDNEKIVLSLIKQYPRLDVDSLQILFTYVSRKSARLDVIFHSLKIKGILDEKAHLAASEIKNIQLPQFEINKEILDNLENLKDTIKLGVLAKSILYVLSKTEKCSLQFLSLFFKKPTKNIYAILQRLEQKNLVLSFNSRIRHVNSNGRKYNPKYYVLTDLGKIWLKVYLNDVINTSKIDELLEHTQKEIKIVSSKF